MTQEALKLALEALERSVATCFDQYAHQQVMSQPDHFINQAITAIKEALREHAMREVQRLGQEIEQEPIGTVKELFTQTAWERLDLRGSTKVYLNTTPPQRGKEPVKYSDYEPDGVHHNKPPQRTWVGLTESERRLINFQWQDGNGTATEIIDLVEAKLKQKNMENT